MIPVLEALFPIFALIALGVFLKSRQWVPDGTWPAVEKMVYYLFFPALLVHRIAGADLGGLNVWPLFGTIWITVLTLSALVIAFRRALPTDGPGFTSVFQGAVRFNTYVALAVPAALFDEAGTIIATMCVAAAIPLINVVCVMVLVGYADSGRDASVKAVVTSLIQNPLILGIIAGLVLNASGLGLPAFIGPGLEILSRAALPMALLAVGAGLNLAAVRAAGGLVGLTTGIKLLFTPLLVWAVGGILGLEGLTLTVCVLWGAMPGAPNAYILARALGGDERMIAGIITATTIAALVTLPLILLILN
ncbi:AEC family transporter [Magnetospira sp. QH-2]|uniref:AEC family transporter n=1 Tax=Magnetospira sp. (strain QH-2) TaxID=1288970 RepID=UPI0003E8166A|nr:AEC family transporter [Magnetospira sp. QH-2]CCQ72507.1 Putative membrane transport protein [Magnetospira sp. QH-2]